MGDLIPHVLHLCRIHKKRSQSAKAKLRLVMIERCISWERACNDILNDLSETHGLSVLPKLKIKQMALVLAVSINDGWLTKVLKNQPTKKQKIKAFGKIEKALSIIEETHNGRYSPTYKGTGGVPITCFSAEWIEDVTRQKEKLVQMKKRIEDEEEKFGPRGNLPNHDYRTELMGERIPAIFKKFYPSEAIGVNKTIYTDIGGAPKGQAKEVRVYVGPGVDFINGVLRNTGIDTAEGVTIREAMKKFNDS